MRAQLISTPPQATAYQPVCHSSCLSLDSSSVVSLPVTHPHFQDPLRLPRPQKLYRHTFGHSEVWLPGCGTVWENTANFSFLPRHSGDLRKSHPSGNSTPKGVPFASGSLPRKSRWKLKPKVIKETGF